MAIDNSIRQITREKLFAILKSEELVRLFESLINSLRVTVPSDIAGVTDVIAAHVADTSGAHQASAIGSIPAGNLSANDVQSALNELDTEKQATLVSGSNIKTINGASLLGSGNLALSGTGDVVGPASAVDSNVVFFSGTTGKLVKDSGLTLAGTNTGDETTATIKTKLGITTLSGANTGDQTSIVGITGTIAQFNTACTDADFATLAGAETLTNKTLTTPALSAPTFSTSAAVTAGTNAQGQGALTSDINVITTAASAPSGVTLPTATVGRMVVVVNKGVNAINVYPATGGAIDGNGANVAMNLPAGAVQEFTASSTTQWYTFQQLANPVVVGNEYVQQGAPASVAAAATLTAAQMLGGIIQYTGAAAALTLPTGTLMDAAVVAGLSVDRAFDVSFINTGTGAATVTAGVGFTIVGAAAVTNGTSARFRCRKTAANTFIAYRVD